MPGENLNQGVGRNVNALEAGKSSSLSLQGTLVYRVPKGHHLACAEQKDLV